MKERRKLTCIAGVAGVSVAALALGVAASIHALAAVLSAGYPLRAVGTLVGVTIFVIGLSFAAGLSAMAGSHFGAVAVDGASPRAWESIRTAIANWRSWVDWVLPVGLVTLVRGVISYSQIGALRDRRRYYVHPVLLFEDVDENMAYHRSEQLDSQHTSTPQRGAVFELQCVSGFVVGFLLAIGVVIWAVLSSGGELVGLWRSTALAFTAIPALGAATTTVAIARSGMRRGQAYRTICSWQ